MRANLPQREPEILKRWREEGLYSRIMEKVSRTVKEKGADAWFKYEVEKFLPKGFSCPKCGNKKDFRKNFRQV